MTPMKDDEGDPINLLFTKTNVFPSHPDSNFRKTQST